MIFQGCGNPNCPCMYFDGKSAEEIMDTFVSGSDEDKRHATYILVPTLLKNSYLMQEQMYSLQDSLDALGNKVGQLMNKPTSGES